MIVRRRAPSPGGHCPVSSSPHEPESTFGELSDGCFGRSYPETEEKL